MNLGDRLAIIRDKLSAPAEKLLEDAESLAQQAAGGDVAYGDELNRLVLAAREVGRRVGQLFSVNSQAVELNRDDPERLGQKLRHDMLNAIGAVEGYAEILEEDAQAAGDRLLQPQLVRLLAFASEFERLVESEIDLGRSAPTAVFRASSGDIGSDRLAARSDALIAMEDKAALTGRILVVDDLEANRDIICDRLSREGHLVTQAANGAAALEFMRRQDFDVVLLDLMMPGISGFEVMAEMRKQARLRDIGVIVISALEQEENAIKSITLGAQDYLPKPVNPVLLRARIGSCLARKQWRDQERLYRMHLEAEKEKSDALLRNTLPETVVKRLASGEKVIADAFESVTVLFSDFVSFTTFAGDKQPTEVVEVLNLLFTEFDDLALDLGIEKIKTIGDGYLAVAGLPVQRPDHADVAADMALGMIEILDTVNRRLGTNLEMRIGLHTGPVVAGVIGSHKFAYDIWGSTVNTAARHESYSKPQRIHVSHQTAALLGERFDVESQGHLDMRGIGEVETFFLLGRKAVPVTPAGERQGAKSGKRGLSILIVDDDENVRDFMARRVRRRGWRSDVAADGAAAWDLLQTHSYDLLISDCDMPDVDGYELARRVRHAEEYSGERLPIVALTGSSTTEVAQQCLDAGMDSFLQKPVMWSELENCIVRLSGIEPAQPAESLPETHRGVASAEEGSADHILDLEVLREIYGSLGDEAIDGLKLFQQTTAEAVARLLKSVQEHEYQAASKAAHAIIGGARTAGANEIAEICTGMKTALDERDVRQVAICAEQVAACYERLRDRIDGIVLAPPVVV